jgi:hypothetical protein
LKWYRRARRFFRQAGEDVKRLGSAVMLLGVSARQHIGLPGAALTTVAIMRSPDFVPQFLTPGTVDSIGCGALVAAYAKTLRDFTTEPFFWQAELMYPGANSYGRMLRHVIQQKIENHPEASVSPHLHLCIVRRGAVDITTSDHDTALYPSGQLVEWRMPRIATTWTEFETMTREAFGASADAGDRWHPQTPPAARGVGEVSRRRRANRRAAGRRCRRREEAPSGAVFPGAPR